MSKDFQTVVDRALEIKNKYHKLEDKKWGLEEQFLGLVTDVGELAELVMAHEGYKNDDNVKEKIEHELADLLYAVIVISDKLGVDLEKSFLKTMGGIEKKLNN